MSLNDVHLPKKITDEWESAVLSMCTEQHKYLLIFLPGNSRIHTKPLL